ncbi:histidine phosphatase family protein [Microvirga lotononidis]|uniref:Fructose-2,6-bisphosphatase n=1 Tax=Microvirga lotononidis TaxID=864069 RepID=I4YLX3_9HYPH|nr:histidine phosphatase family protein [Microvirga lotononidis]EIM24965.1 fructose-2,6-bisphosphatase [Microvirga lotononidis]WQO29539.1 histidine phosphatase family protein [Microvirga lotononidis]
MTTTFYLVRHADHDRVGTVLCGRMPDVHLGSVGRAQAERLAQRFGDENVAGIYTSPLERAVETAQPIAARLAQACQVCDAISEIDVGRWSGLSFEVLNQDPLWSSWNSSRGTNRAPEGETMLEVQARVVGAMERMRNRHAERSVILVSHSDVIKAALLYHLGMPIDAYTRIEVEPASTSTLVIGDWGSKLLRLNEVVAA